MKTKYKANFRQTVRDGEKNTENVLTRQPDQVQATWMNLSFLYLLPVNAKTTSYVW